MSFGAEGETRQGAALSVRCANDPIVCPFLLRKKMDGSVLVSPGWEVANKKKRYQGKSLIPFGAEGETRTLAPVARPTPLAGAPRHQLEYFSMATKNKHIMAESKGSNPTLSATLQDFRFRRSCNNKIVTVLLPMEKYSSW